MSAKVSQPMPDAKRPPAPAAPPLPKRIGGGVIDDPGIPEKMDHLFWRRIRDGFRSGVK